MKIICAPDKFKESLTAQQAAAAMARGICRVLPDAEMILCPIADGGDGTVDAMLAATAGQSITTRVRNPRGTIVSAQWGMLGQRDGQPPAAVIEMAQASGLALLPAAQRDPTQTSSYGTGQLIAAALDQGARHILIGIGGSATNDGGCGALQALGARFFNTHDALMTSPVTGGDLKTITRIDLSQLRSELAQTTITVACDVSNPLTGKDGAAAIYGPQKGATPQQVTQLDNGLAHLATLWQSQLHKDVATHSGSGAAGGMGGGLMAMLNANLQGGVQMVLEAVNFELRAKGATLCFTGEGRLDGQSLSGKACLGVAAAARRVGVLHVIALVGSASNDAVKTLDAGLSSYHVIGEGLSKEESMRRAAELLENAAAKVVLAAQQNISQAEQAGSSWQ